MSPGDLVYNIAAGLLIKRAFENMGTEVAEGTSEEGTGEHPSGLSKADVYYSEDHKSSHYCEDCRHFSRGFCDLIKDSVRSGGTCDRWSK